MKFISLSCFLIVLFLSCNKDQTNNSSTGVIDYKQKMREFVIGISQYSKAINPNFNIIPQNGIELVSSSGDNPANPHTAYLSAIDANGQEDLIYGYNTDDQLTPFDTTVYLRNFLNLSKNTNKKILVIDYCFTHSKMDSSYLLNNNSGYISFAADKRQLNDIPNYPTPIYQENNSTITSILQAKNFLYLINLSNYSTKADFIKAVTATNYDLLITDLFFNDGTAFTAAEINQLKNKANGGKRLVVSYMSIGEAENYRYYWQSNWKANNPVWLDAENPNWQGNFKVKYWYPEWQSIIYGNDNSYVKKIINAGFDGAYLDIIDAFRFYESK